MSIFNNRSTCHESNPNSDYIVNQFLDNSVDEIEFQKFSEVYSVLSELENYEAEERTRLLNHIDEFADEVPGQTPTDFLYDSAAEIAEEFEEFISERLEAESNEFEGNYPKVLTEQSRVYLGDRLRYLEDSCHSK